MIKKKLSFKDNMLTRTGPKLAILIAEDDAVSQKAILLMLENLGYHADVVANGIEVLRTLHRGYDVILMDVGMPEMDGLETTKYIRHHSPAKEQPHIIAITADGRINIREICLDAGMDDFISKPIRIGELKSALQVVKRETRKIFSKESSAYSLTSGQIAL